MPISKILPQTLKKGICVGLTVAFFVTSLYMPQAQAAGLVLPPMPRPGVMVGLSPEFNPAHLQGLTIHPTNALQFDFLINRGDIPLTEDQKKIQYKNLVKYFLASLTIPDNDQWVNLSPYEKDRIIKNDFGKTEMGRDLLAQDYLLKQITSSLVYPEKDLGKKFWNRVYARAWSEYRTTEVPVSTFNKVWIVPDEAAVYESGNTVYVLRNHLKVMLEEDYLSLKNHSGIQSPVPADSNKLHAIGSQIIKEIVLPELEREVNQDKNFANLRQIYSGMILATWYKHALKQSLLGQVYANKAKVKGVDQDPRTNQLIYRQYLKAFKKGVFNYIKEDEDRYTNEVIPRKYFSGGTLGLNGEVENAKRFIPDTVVAFKDQIPASVAAEINPDDLGMASLDSAMINLSGSNDFSDLRKNSEVIINQIQESTWMQIIYEMTPLIERAFAPFGVSYLTTHQFISRYARATANNQNMGIGQDLGIPQVAIDNLNRLMVHDVIEVQLRLKKIKQERKNWNQQNSKINHWDPFAQHLLALTRQLRQLKITDKNLPLTDESVAKELFYLLFQEDINNLIYTTPTAVNAQQQFLATQSTLATQIGDSISNLGLHVEALGTAHDNREIARVFRALGNIVRTVPTMLQAASKVEKGPINAEVVDPKKLYTITSQLISEDRYPKNLLNELNLKEASSTLWLKGRENLSPQNFISSALNSFLSKLPKNLRTALLRHLVSVFISVGLLFPGATIKDIENTINLSPSDKQIANAIYDYKAQQIEKEAQFKKKNWFQRNWELLAIAAAAILFVFLIDSTKNNSSTNNLSSIRADEQTFAQALSNYTSELSPDYWKEVEIGKAELKGLNARYEAAVVRLNTAKANLESAKKEAARYQITLENLPRVETILTEAEGASYRAAQSLKAAQAAVNEAAGEVTSSHEQVLQKREGLLQQVVVIYTMVEGQQGQSAGVIERMHQKLNQARLDIKDLEDKDSLLEDSVKGIRLDLKTKEGQLLIEPQTNLIERVVSLPNAAYNFMVLTERRTTNNVHYDMPLRIITKTNHNAAFIFTTMFVTTNSSGNLTELQAQVKRTEAALDKARRDHHQAYQLTHDFRELEKAANKAKQELEHYQTSKTPGYHNGTNLYGGIDLNSANLRLIINHNGRGMTVPLTKQDLVQFSRIQGLIPEIVRIRPVANLPIISEIQQKLSAATP